jgi:carboxypeptidase Taq
VEAIALWDEATVMPEGSSSARAEAVSFLRGLIHEQLTLPEVAELFATVEKQSVPLVPWEAANLREMRRAWVQAVAVPRPLVEASSLAESRCEQAWRKLRPANNFAEFLPLFREVVRLKREVARCLGDRLSLAPYDALLDSFQPGLHQVTIAPLFARLRDLLPDLIGQAMARQAKMPPPPSPSTIPGAFPVDSQRKVAVEVMQRLGFDFQRGRLDTTHHPFCGGVAEDVRIALRYDEADFLPTLAGVIHECGHGKYQQHLPDQWRGQPVALARGACIHESQSLLHEMQVGRSEAFLSFVSPILIKALGANEATAATLSAQVLRRRLTHVTPSLIRVDADELTYPCHIILRFELEKGLFDGSVQPDDVPALWDEGMRELLGMSTKGNDRDGCMQDVHWPAGMFGYFPSYLLGALLAAQLFRAAKRALPNLMDDISHGSLARLDAWLEQKIWANGSFLDTTQLIEQATGAPLGTEAFEEHIKSRYLLGES